jgi:hypothetical protein
MAAARDEDPAAAAGDDYAPATTRDRTSAGEGSRHRDQNDERSVEQPHDDLLGENTERSRIHPVAILYPTRGGYNGGSGDCDLILLATRRGGAVCNRPLHVLHAEMRGSRCGA